MYLSWILDPCIHSCWFPIRYVSKLDPNKKPILDPVYKYLLVPITYYVSKLNLHNKPILDPCINYLILITYISKQNPNHKPILDR